MEVVIYTSISLLSVQGEEKPHPSVYIVYNIYIKMGKMSEGRSVILRFLSFFLSFLRIAFDRREMRKKVYIVRRVVFVLFEGCTTREGN